ncbi:MAG TPA: hypothetical protein VHX14_19170 [Thermoanaerobaculia bacterium]|nr:hypothetical protein [Thermoanaerobaculia bacterium]
MEPDETFAIIMVGADNATFSTAPATCTIVNDDAQVAPATAMRPISVADATPAIAGCGLRDRI